MGTKISWADESWNPVVGCSKISAGCMNCYAEKMANRLSYMEIKNAKAGKQRPYTAVIKGKGKWFGNTVFVESALTKPLHWRKPRKIFVVSMGDLFHESVPFEWIDRIFAVMALCPQHTFMLLTKRAGRMREYVGWRSDKPDIIGRFNRGQKIDASGYIGKYICGFTNRQWPIPNLHLGVTVENQKNVGRIDDLVRTPAAKRFVSFEPLLEYIQPLHKELKQMDYAFIGCESGPQARLCDLDDIRYMMQQCRAAGVKIHVKQIPLNGKCNKNFDEWPEEFQTREV